MYLAQFWQAHVHACSEASAKVRRTSENVAQSLIPHELPASLLDQFLHLHRKVIRKKKAFINLTNWTVKCLISQKM